MMVTVPDLERLVDARFVRSARVPERFFEDESDRIAQACWAMAKRFHAGGRLLTFGSGALASDAQHIAVEFVHPVIVGKRALPALALTNDSALLGGRDFARHLALLARPQDIAVGFGDDANVIAALEHARQIGLLTLLLTSGAENASSVDFCFSVQSCDPLVVQETHETLYHVLWELVHVFFEHEGLLT